MTASGCDPIRRTSRLWWLKKRYGQCAAKMKAKHQARWIESRPGPIVTARAAEYTYHSSSQDDRVGWGLIPTTAVRSDQTVDDCSPTDLPQFRPTPILMTQAADTTLTLLNVFPTLLQTFYPTVVITIYTVCSRFRDTSQGSRSQYDTQPSANGLHLFRHLRLSRPKYQL